MPPIRVLIVDDSLVVRRMVSEVLAEDADLEVVGVAANGRFALGKIDRLIPDVIILDVEMPELDGLATLKALRQTHQSIPVIMFSTVTARGAEATLDALALGASDYVTKPASVGHIDEAMDRIRGELIPRIKALCGRVGPWVAGRVPAVNVKERTAEPRIARPTGRPPKRSVAAVVVGVSTGGPNALAEIFTTLPSDLPVPIFVVQHMPPTFTKFLADRLFKSTQFDVREGQQGDLVRPGIASIAPGGYHMAIEAHGDETYITVLNSPPQNSCRPAVDVLFRSAAKRYGPDVLGVLLTGMGRDGFRGCRSIREAGGQVIVQDKASSVVWGMPGFVAQQGLADRVLPLSQIAGEIISRVNQGLTVANVRASA